MNNPQHENERTIYIRDLFITVCQRWRSLLVCFVIGAIVIGAYGWWKSGENGALTSEQAEALGLSLGKGRKAVIESYASDINESTEQIVRQGQYNSSAAIMKIDPLHVSVHELKYYVDMENYDGISRSAVLQSYILIMQDIFFERKINAVIEDGKGLSQSEFYEIPNLTKIDKQDLDNGFLTFQIYYEPGQEESSIDELKAAMRTAEGIVQDEQGDHSMKLIGESSYVYADMDIVTIQENNLKRINDLTDRIDKIKKAVTNASEEKYLNYLLMEYENDPSVPGSTVVVKSSRHISKKYILIGAVLGVILAAIIIIIKYIASNSIKTVQEIENRFDLQILGRFEGSIPFYKKRNTKFDKWLRNKKNKNNSQMFAEEMAGIVATKVQIEAEKNDLHSICLAVDSKVTGDTDYLKLIMEKLGDGLTVKVTQNLLERADELKGMSGMDGVILVEQIEQSGYDDLKNVYYLCQNYHVNVIGSIILE